MPVSSHAVQEVDEVFWRCFRGSWREWTASRAAYGGVEDGRAALDGAAALAMPVLRVS